MKVSPTDETELPEDFASGSTMSVPLGGSEISVLRPPTRKRSVAAADTAPHVDRHSPGGRSIANGYDTSVRIIVVRRRVVADIRQGTPLFRHRPAARRLLRNSSSATMCRNCRFAACRCCPQKVTMFATVPPVLTVAPLPITMLPVPLMLSVISQSASSSPSTARHCRWCCRCIVSVPPVATMVPLRR